MTKHYLELTGASAEKVQFGAKPYSADDLFGGFPPSVEINGQSFELVEISSISMTVRDFDADPIVEDGIYQVSFRHGTHEIGRGVVRLRPTEKETRRRIFDCTERAFDLKALVSANAAAAAGTMLIGKAVTGVDVPVEYKLFCADVLDYLGTHRSHLRQVVEPLERELSPYELSQLSVTACDSVRNEWQELLRRGNEIVLAHHRDRRARRALKRFTENVVTPELMGGAIFNRSYHKPAGYPGDYKIMNYLYDGRAVGNTAYERYLHLLGLIAGDLVVKRMYRIQERILALSSAHPGTDMFHVMSVGAGPAREVQGFFERWNGGPEGYSFTLVDQDTEALEYAIDAAYRHAGGLSRNVVSALNTSFKNMLDPKGAYRHLPKQHLIYSAGLVDYLNPRIARELVHSLYDMLAPGGSVVIGNVNDLDTGGIWTIEYALDWTLFFRSKEEMLAMADGLEEAEVDVVGDGSGAVYMLTVTKPS